MINKCFLFFLVFLFSVSAYSQHERHYTSMISGRVISTEKEIVDFATVYLKGTNYGSYTDEKGIYHLKTVEGDKGQCHHCTESERVGRGRSNNFRSWPGK